MRVTQERAILLISVFAALGAGAGRAQGAPDPRPVTLAQALSAVGQAPEALATASRVAAAEARVRAAGAAPPTLVHAGTASATAHLLAGAEIPLPIFGRLGADRAVARAERDVARAEAGGVDLGLRYEVTVAWLELARLEARASLAADTAARADELAKVAAKRFDAGDAPRLETVQADAARARARAEEAAAKRAVAGASAELAGLLGWDPVARLHAEGGLPSDVPAPPPLDEMRRDLADHPQVRAAAARVEAAAARVTAASRDRFPALSLLAETEAFDPTLPGSDFRGELVAELPLFGRRGAARDAAAAARATAEAERDRIRAAADSALVAAYRRYQGAADTRRALEREVVPAQREADRLAHVAYREGQGGMTAVLQADRALLEVQVELVDARANAAEAYAELERAAGGRL